MQRSVRMPADPAQYAAHDILRSFSRIWDTIPTNKTEVAKTSLDSDDLSVAVSAPNGLVEQF